MFQSKDNKKGKRNEKARGPERERGDLESRRNGARRTSKKKKPRTPGQKKKKSDDYASAGGKGTGQSARLGQVSERSTAETGRGRGPGEDVAAGPGRGSLLRKWR